MKKNNKCLSNIQIIAVENTYHSCDHLYATRPLRSFFARMCLSLLSTRASLKAPNMRWSPPCRRIDTVRALSCHDLMISRTDSVECASQLRSRIRDKASERRFCAYVFVRFVHAGLSESPKHEMDAAVSPYRSRPCVCLTKYYDLSH